jgi:hypothetical protein
MGVPKMCVEAVSAMMPAAVKITPTIWIKKRLATQRFYQCKATILKTLHAVLPPLESWVINAGLDADLMFPCW